MSVTLGKRSKGGDRMRCYWRVVGLWRRRGLLGGMQ